MSDNVAITAGSGTTVAADDISGVLVQRVKATWGPDGTMNDADVASGKALPVQVRSATGLIPLGEPTDAKSTATDTTSASLVAIAKQISASAQLSATETTLAALTISPANYLQGGVFTAMAGTTSTAVTGFGAPGAATYNYITDIIISNSHATVGTLVILQDGNGGATFGSFPAGPAYGGSGHTFAIPLKQPTANTALYAADVTTGASVTFTLTGYKGA